MSNNNTINTNQFNPSAEKYRASVSAEVHELGSRRANIVFSGIQQLEHSFNALPDDPPEAPAAAATPAASAHTPRVPVAAVYPTPVAERQPTTPVVTVDNNTDPKPYVADTSVSSEHIMAERYPTAEERLAYVADLGESIGMNPEGLPGVTVSSADAARAAVQQALMSAGGGN